jgi:4-hydroxybenzoate polyprenyltransferase
LALLIVLGYSYTKRFTSLSHLFLGVSLGIAPVGGWIAVRGSLEWEAVLLGAAVAFWVAGFDIIYACQDVESDLRQGLHSLPRRLGVQPALRMAAAFHFAMVALLFYSFWSLGLSLISWLGLALTAAALVYEHSLVSAKDLGRVNASFFTVNGLISVLLFLFVGLDLCLVL